MNHYANAREAQRREAWARYDANVALMRAQLAVKAWAATCTSSDRRMANAMQLYKQVAGVTNSVSALQIDSRLPSQTGTP